MTLKRRGKEFKEMSMTKTGILLTSVILLSIAASANAQDKELGVEVGATWVSKYLWYGIDRLDDKAAWLPSVNFDLYGTGLSVGVQAVYPGTGKHAGARSTVNATRYDYMVNYACTLFEGQNHVTDVTVGWIYYDFIDMPSKGTTQADSTVYGDAQQIGVGLAWPEICPAGVVPSYYVGYMWPAKENSLLPTHYEGWVHIVGLGYGLALDSLSPDLPEQVLNLSAAAVYNDGFAAADHDWSHAIFGVSTDVDVAENLVFTPGFYYQSSWEDTVNKSDEYWASLGAKYRF
jgi:hypothetical protein